MPSHDVAEFDAQAWLESTLGRLVGHPERLVVVMQFAMGGTVFRVSTAPGDERFILGRRGATINALRTVLSAMGGRAERRYTLEMEGASRSIGPSNRSVRYRMQN